MEMCTAGTPCELAAVLFAFLLGGALGGCISPAPAADAARFPPAADPAWLAAIDLAVGAMMIIVDPRAEG